MELFTHFHRLKHCSIKKEGITNDIEFAEYFLMEADVAVVPGSAFGAPGHIRFSYATSMKNLTEAVKNLRKAVEKLTK